MEFENTKISPVNNNIIISWILTTALLVANIIYLNIYWGEFNLVPLAVIEILGFLALTLVVLIFFFYKKWDMTLALGAILGIASTALLVVKVIYSHHV